MKTSQNKKPKTSKRRATPRPSKQSSALQDFERRIAAGEKLKRSELAAYHELEKKRDKGEVVHGGQDAAKYCGTSKRILSYHIARGSLRQNPDGTFDKAELDRWLASRDRREKGPEVKKYDASQRKADLRYREARADREEMLVEQMKDNLASRKEIEAEWSGRVLEITSGLEALIDRLPGLLVGKSRDEIRAVLKEEVRTLRENYSRAGRYTPEAG